MPSGQASPLAFSSSTTGDRALLDARLGCIAAPRRACARAEEYRPAAGAGRRGGRRQGLSPLRPFACRLAYEPCRIRAGGDPARLAADRLLCPAPAGPNLGDRELGRLLDNAH